MRVLVLGSGGREHALAWRLSRDPDVKEVIAAPGNPGVAAVARCASIDLQAHASVLALAEDSRVDLTIVGPEAPLERGLGDVFRRAGRPILGPSARGAALECSKAFAKEFMARHHIPTARFRICDTFDDAMESVTGRDFGFPVVVKADGLAAGKGVVVARTREEAEEAARAAMLERRFGGAGSRLVIEECLTGPEVSVFVLADGQRAVLLGAAQDHKRLHDDDQGPNTGGMGAFSPSPLATPALLTPVLRDIVQPVLDGMRAEGEPYVGFLYVSLMLTPDGPKVIEFNVRFGDPEAQVVMPTLKGHLARVLLAAAKGSLDHETVEHTPDRAVGIVLASRGYPGHVETGQRIAGLDQAERVPGVLVFHAGTSTRDGHIVTAGGRVLTVVGRAPTFEKAMARAYEAAQMISFEGMQYRHDIGRKAISA
jgi:phosphoribosylamine---glycine ligase